MQTCTCLICGAIADSETSAIDAGWLPAFWADERTDVSGPVCPTCSDRYLSDHDAEPILKPEYRSLPLIGNWQR